MFRRWWTCNRCVSWFLKGLWHSWSYYFIKEITSLWHHYAYSISSFNLKFSKSHQILKAFPWYTYLLPFLFALLHCFAYQYNYKMKFTCGHISRKASACKLSWMNNVFVKFIVLMFVFYHDNKSYSLIVLQY